MLVNWIEILIKHAVKRASLYEQDPDLADSKIEVVRMWGRLPSQKKH